MSNITRRLQAWADGEVVATQAIEIKRLRTELATLKEAIKSACKDDEE